MPAANPRTLCLKWPNCSGDDLLREASRPFQVYGVGKHEGNLYILSSRESNSKRVNPARLVVPGAYGKFLERLCYTCRFNTLAWMWISESKFYEGEYHDLAVLWGRIWKFHKDSLDAVVQEVDELDKQENHNSIDYRITTLNEWVIRNHHELLQPDSLDQALKAGTFLHDVLIHPEYQGVSCI